MPRFSPLDEHEGDPLAGIALSVAICAALYAIVAAVWLLI